MIDSCVAIFYDGSSSTPFQAVLVEDETGTQLKISIDQQGIATTSSWPLNATHIEFSGSGRLLLSFNQDIITKQLLEISDPVSIRQIQDLLRKHGRMGWYSRLSRRSWKSYLFISLLVIAILAAAYVYALPFVAEQAVVFIPVSVDQAIGENAYKQIIPAKDIDSAKTVQLQKLAAGLNFGQRRRSIIPVVVNDKTVNAFALPDGHIVVYSGILDVIQTPEELAALLGHEYTHVAHRHMMKLLSRNFAGYFIISLALSDANGIIAVLADNAHSLSGFSFSRHFEEEADAGAFDLLKANAIPAEGMLHLLEALKKENKFAIPEFLSTHPLTSQRIASITKKTKDHPYTGSIRPELQQAFDCLKGKCVSQ